MIKFNDHLQAVRLGTTSHQRVMLLAPREVVQRIRELLVDHYPQIRRHS